MSSYNQFKNFLWYLIPFGFKNFLPLIALPVFTRYISVEEFGLYALAIFYGSVIAGIVNLGLSGVFERSFFELDSIMRKNLLWTILLFILLLYSFFFILTVQIAGFIASTIFQVEAIGDLLILALSFQVFKSLNLYYLSYFKNYENAKKYTYVAIIESGLSIGLALHLVMNYGMGITGFLLGQLIGVGLCFFFLFIYLFFPFTRVFEWSLLKKQLELSLPLTPRIFFGVINTQFDRYMLGLLSAMGGVGIFDISQKIANTSFVFMTTIQNTFSPTVYKKLFSKDKSEFNSVGKYLTPFFYLCILFSIIVGLFSYEILLVLTTESFHSGAPIISLLTILYGFYFFGKQPQLMFAKKTGLISFLSFFSILSNIALNIPLIYYYGIYGAAIATTISGIMSSLIGYYFAQKYAPILWEKRVFIILGYFTTTIVLVIILDYLQIEYLLLLLIKISFFIIYLILGNRYGYITIKKVKNLYQLLIHEN